MTGQELADAASSLVGTRFRLHGRDPEGGLDCIGLLHAAMQRVGKPIALPSGYPLRFLHIDGWLPDAAACGFGLAEPPFEPGDVVLLRPATGQTHLAIAAGGAGWFHAHAGLRRVVLSPILPDGPVLHHWRLLPPS